jgi:uncharacterized membrane protein
MQRSPVALAFIALFAILVGVTVLGVAQNWPRTRTIPTPASLRQPKLLKAHVVALRTMRCRVPGLKGCSLVTAQLDEGSDKGKRTAFRFGDTGGDVQLGLGDRVLVVKNQLPPGAVGGAGTALERYSFADFQRGHPLLLLLFVFAVVVLVGGRFHGLRALAGLAASLATIVFFVIPAIVDGRSPLQVAGFGGLGVMLLTIPLVHGGGAKSIAACLGTAGALLITLTLADVFTHGAHLTGLTSDESLYLQATSHVSIVGLLLAGMVIGSLGVLGDTTVTQASTVLALRRANPGLGFGALVQHATAVGRDHIAATVNTLVLAYTGAALPTLIIFSLAGTSLERGVTTEAVAEAVVATLVGSIGLILAVPATTALAALLALHLPERSLRHAHAHVHSH